MRGMFELPLTNKLCNNLNSYNDNYFIAQTNIVNKKNLLALVKSENLNIIKALIILILPSISKQD